LSLFRKELLQLSDDALEVWLTVLYCLQIRLAIPNIEQHHHLLLIHTKTVGMSHNILLEELDEGGVPEVGKFNVNELLFFFSHLSPELSLLD
jgi:hypothetical protein